MSPGDVGMYDAAYVARHAPWLRRVLHGWFRAEVDGWSRLPTTPFVAVGNHSGGMMIPDTLVWLAAYHTADRPVPLLTLAHDGFFKTYPKPLATAVARLGAIRADRKLARRALEQGFAVQIYPGGDFDACRSIRDRNRIVFAGRTGYAALAIEAGVPVLPVVSIGGHETLLVLTDGAGLAKRLPLMRRLRLTTCPVSLGVPWGLTVGLAPFLPLPAKIAVRVLDPVPTRGRTVEAVDAEVRGALQAALDELAAQRKVPIWG